MNTQKSILEKKISDYIDIGTNQAMRDINSIRNDYNILQDHIATCDNLSFTSNGKVTMAIGEMSNFTIHENAVRQSAERMGIPTKYMKDLIISEDQWKRDLASETLNKHFENTIRQRMLVRSVGTQVRGILSDKYKRFNSLDIYTAFLNEARVMNARVARSYKSDTRSYLEIIRPEIITIDTPHNGTINLVIGARLRNSDFGDGALDISVFHINVVCMNGMTTKNVIRNIHLGSKIPDNIHMSDETYQKDTELRIAITKDSIRHVFSEECIQKEIYAIQKAANKEIDIKSELKKLPQMDFRKSEIADLEILLLNNRVEDGLEGKPTQWKLLQAMAAIARDHQDEQRKRDIEEIVGSKLVTEKEIQYSI